MREKFIAAVNTVIDDQGALEVEIMAGSNGAMIDFSPVNIDIGESEIILYSDAGGMLSLKTADIQYGPEDEVFKFGDNGAFIFISIK